jgi:hypothetical protein
MRNLSGWLLTSEDDPEDEKLASSQSPHERDHLTNGAAQPNSQLDDADESETALTVKRRRKPKRRAKDKVAKMPAFDGQADASEVEVPNTQNALQEINGTLSPEAASRAAPGISPQNGRSKRERKRRSRAEITVEMSDGAELPHSQLEPEV